MTSDSAPPRHRVLIVSPHWPPINAPDMQRARMSLPYYRKLGWEPVVLAVGDRSQDGVREPELLRTIPPDVEVHLTGAIPSKLARCFGVGNIGLRAWLPLFFAGARLLRGKRIDLVFFTNTQFATFPLGRIWRFLYGVPYVLDLQDPWRTDYYERSGSRRPPGGWKYQLARFMAWLLEGWSFRRASGLMSVSPAYIEDLRRRYPWFHSVPAEVIRFGASRLDLQEAALLPPPSHRYRGGTGERHFLYTGAAGPVMPHALTVLFESLQQYRNRSPGRARLLRFHFLGTSYVAPGQGQNTVMPIAVKCGVADQVEEIPHRLGHLECIRLQRDTDFLLLPGSSDLAYSPSKIYPYYLAERPILALIFKNSVLEKILAELNCAVVARFQENESKDEAHKAIMHFFDQALEGFPAGALPQRDHAFFERHFLAESLTELQCQLFDRALRSSHD